MSKRISILILIIVIILAICYNFYFLQATRQNTGVVITKNICLSASKTGVIEYIFVAKGQNVTKGDNVFSLDSELESIDVEMARANVKYQEAHLAMVEASFNKDMTKYREAQADYENEMKNNKSISLITERKRKTTMDNVSISQQELNMAKASLDIAKTKLTKEEQKANSLTLTAPIEGFITNILFEEGEQVAMGDEVVCIEQAENFTLRFYASENELNKYNIGKNLSLKCESCPSDLSASINYIAQLPKYNQNFHKNVYEVEALIKGDYKLTAGQEIYFESEE